MTGFGDNVRTVAAEIAASVRRVDPEQVDALVRAIAAASTVHLVGVGREGLATRAFAMRLMHAGVPTHWVWDDTTPAIGPEDLLIAASGSGQIGHIDQVARRAKDHGAALAVATAEPRGQISRIADHLLVVPGAAYGAGDDVVASIQPMGSLFEQSLLVTFDLVVLELITLRNTTFEEMSDRHRNVE